MFCVKNRSVHNYNTRNKDKLRPAMANHAYRDIDFRLVGVHVWNYINIATSFDSFKRILKKCTIIIIIIIIILSFLFFLFDMTLIFY